MSSVSDMESSDVGLGDRDYMQEPVRQRALRGAENDRDANGRGLSWWLRVRFAFWRLLRRHRAAGEASPDQKK